MAIMPHAGAGDLWRYGMKFVLLTVLLIVPMMSAVGEHSGSLHGLMHAGSAVLVIMLLLWSCWPCWCRVTIVLVQGNHCGHHRNCAPPVPPELDHHEGRCA